MLVLILIVLVMILIAVGGGPVLGSIINFIIFIIAIALRGTWVTANGYWPHILISGAVVIAFTFWAFFRNSSRSTNQSTINQKAVKSISSLSEWRQENRATKLYILENMLEQNDALKRIEKLGWEPIKLVQEICFAQEGRSTYMQNLKSHELETVTMELIESIEDSENKQ